MSKLCFMKPKAMAGIGYSMFY